MGRSRSLYYYYYCYYYHYYYYYYYYYYFPTQQSCTTTQEARLPLLKIINDVHNYEDEFFCSFGGGGRELISSLSFVFRV